MCFPFFYMGISPITFDNWFLAKTRRKCVMTTIVRWSMLPRPTMRKGKHNVLEIPNYSPMEAVRYFHIPSSTLAYWTEEPNQLVVLASQTPPLLSFKNLVELYVLE